jgi:C1A family cysteine protease
MEAPMIRRTRATAGSAQRTDPTRRRFLKNSAIFASGVAVGSIAPGVALAAPPVGPPDAFDLRARLGMNYITSIKDQGSCHSCTAFGVLATIEGSHHWQKNLPIGGSNQELNLSEDDLFNNGTPAGNCNIDHWWPRTALDYCTFPGVEQVPATQPYQIRSRQQLVGGDVEDTITRMKTWISDENNKGGPLIAVMIEYDDFLRFGANRTPGPTDVTDVYEAGWERGPCTSKPIILGGHVVSIVGYEDLANSRYWICKNSWYVNEVQPWNGNGYVRIKMKGDSYIDRIDVWGVKV